MKIYKVEILTDYNYSDEIKRDEEYFIDLDNALWEVKRFGPAFYSKEVTEHLGYLAYHTSDEWLDDTQAILFTDHESPKFRQTAILTAVQTMDFAVESAQAKRPAAVLGSITSDAKAAAARANGKRGGRPRKTTE